MEAQGAGRARPRAGGVAREVRGVETKHGEREVDDGGLWRLQGQIESRKGGTGGEAHCGSDGALEEAGEVAVV